MADDDSDKGEDRPEAKDDGAGDQGQDDKHWAAQFWVTIALLIVLVLFGIYLMNKAADGDETAWQHRAYVFGTVEAIAFTAVGWLFGREVHRSEAQTAKKSAAEAKEDAAAARQEADTAKANTHDAEVKATKARTKMQDTRVAVTHLVDAEPTPAPGGAVLTGLDEPAGSAGAQPDARRIRNLVEALLDDDET